MRKLLTILFLLTSTHLFAQTSEVYEKAADGYLKDRDYQVAFDNYSKAIKKSAQDNVRLSILYYKRGESLGGLSSSDAALKDFNHSIELNPQNSAAYWGRGYLYQYNKNFLAAISDYDTVLKLVGAYKSSESFAYLYCNIGYCQLGLKNYNEALQADSTALSINERYGQAYTLRAMIHRALNKPELVVDDYTKAIESFTGDNKKELSAIIADRAYAKMYLKQYKPAINDFTLAINLNPENKFAYWNRAATYHYNSDYKLATDDYTSAIALYKDDNINSSKLYDDKAVNEMEQNLFTEAIHDDSVAIALNSLNKDAYLNKAEAYTNNADYKSGIDIYILLLDIDKGDNKLLAYINYSIANNEYFLNEFDKVITSCTKAIELDPTYSESYFYRAKVYLKKMNNKDLANKDFDKVLSLDTTKKSVGYIFSLFYLGRGDEAVAIYNNDILATNNDAILTSDYYGLACLYSLMNKPNEANIYLKKSIDNGFAKKYAIADEDLDNIRNTDDYKAIMADKPAQ